MGKFLEVLGMILAMVIAGALVRGCMSSSVGTAPSSPPSPSEVVYAASRESNKNLPMMIDSETRLDSTVPGPGSTFSYLYTMVNYSSASIDPDFVASLAPQVVHKVCTSTEMRKILSLGVTTFYIYRGNDGTEIGRIRINQNDCSAKSANVAPAPQRTAVLSPTIGGANSSASTTANISSAATLTNLELGSSTNAYNQIIEPTVNFSRDDVIHASVATDGPYHLLSARWTYEDGQLVDSQSKSVPAGPQVTDFSISKPDGWPRGHYTIEVSINSRLAASQTFQVVN